MQRHPYLNPNPKRIRKVAVAAIAAPILSLQMSVGASAVMAGSYTIYDLSPNTVAVDINAAGQVVGNALDSSGLQQAFIYDSTGLHLLGTLGGTESFAGGINTVGQTAGAWATADGAVHAFLHTGDGSLAPTDALAPLTGFDRNAAADVNDAGVAVGSAYHSNASGQRAVKWLQGGLVDLGVLSGGDVSGATAINSSGQIAGYSNSNASRQHAALFEDDSVHDLGILSGGDVSFAYDLNDYGQVVGYSEYDNSLHSGHLGHAFLWQNGVMTDLGIGVDSSALGINNSDQIVGSASSSISSNIYSAFLWQDGTAFDLNTLIEPGTGWILTSANGINDHGQIVGYGTYQGQMHAFVLTPTIPEPNTFVLAIIGLLPLIRVIAGKRSG